MKNNNFKIIFHYLKDEKLLIFIYMLLVVINYVPSLLSAYFWGLGLEYLLKMNFKMFLIFLLIWESIHILCYTVLAYPRDSIYNYLEIKFSKNALKDLYHKTSNLPAGAFEEKGVGEFINRMTSDPDRVMDLLSNLIRMICKSLVVIVIVIICIKTSLILTLEIFIFGLIMGFISKKFFPKIKKSQEKIKKQSDINVKKMTENLNGIREVKALGIKETQERQMFFNIDSLFKESRIQKKNELKYYNLNNLIYFLLELVILITCGRLYIIHKLSFAMFIMIDSYIWKVDDIVESISEFGVNYNKVSVSLKRIDEIINNKLYKDESFGSKNIENINGIIEFKDVYMKYKKDENNTLNGLNLKLVPNKKIAIVGRSGNGKTTIFNLLLRYFDATKGEVLIDGINIKDLSESSLRSSISIIRQNPFLFNLSIIDNFKLVKEDVTIEEIKKVCKKAYIHDYIMSLPNKYNTIIGEGGVNLSGGQKQRLAIARTLLLNTKIILFDEATSALDNESQEYIKKTIDNLVCDHTVVIIAHRLSTIIDADIINVIENGTLVETGTHKELIKDSKIYKKLYNTEL